MELYASDAAPARGESNDSLGKRLMRAVRPEEAVLLGFLTLLAVLMVWAATFQFRLRHGRWLWIGVALAALLWARGTRAALEQRAAREVLLEAGVEANAPILRRRRALRLGFRPAARSIRDFFPFFACVCVYEALHDLTPALSSRLYDGHLSRIDQVLTGVIPSLWFEALATPALTRVLAACYGSYYFAAPALAALLYYAGEHRAFRDFLLSLVVVTYVGFVGYLLVPAVGPYIWHADLFQGPLPGSRGNFIMAAVDGVKGVHLATSARDCFPSLHTATTVTVLLFARRFRPHLFWLYLPVAVGLIVATIYLRYHYLVDLAAGALLAFAAARVGPSLDRFWSQAASDQR